MGQKAAKPLPVLQQEPEQEACLSGLVPRSTLARAACNTRRVRKLIRAGRLGACWMPLADGQGIECPVCMELYSRLNHTACCHQNICTECFISIVAPGCGAAARCPYCQTRALQVYLPPPSSACPAAAPPETNAASSEEEAAAAGSMRHLQRRSAAGEGQLLLRLENLADGTSAASSTRGSGGLDDVLLVGAVASGCPPNAAAATAAATAEMAARAVLASLACQRPKHSRAGGASLAALLAAAGPSSRCRQLEALAEAAGAASQLQTLTVGMVVVASPGSPAAAGSSSSGSAVAGSSAVLAAAQGLAGSVAFQEAGSSPGAAAVTAPVVASGSRAAAEGTAIEAAAAAAAGNGVVADGETPGEAAPANLAGCPALLLNPDGTEQLVLLSSGQPAAEAPEGSLGAGTSGGTQEEPAVPSYQPPSNPEDDRMRDAIARADAAFLRPRRAGGAHPPSGVGRGGDWLEQLRRADAALRAAVAANDQQHFGSAAGGGGEGSSS